MANPSPNRKPLEEMGAIFMPYGVEGVAPIDVAQVVEGLEREYRALRGACVLIDQPQRGTLEITGADRHEFLNNMVTQEVKGLGAGETRRSFWLNRKGRVDADLRLAETGSAIWADVDAHRAAHAVETLGGFVFAEEMEIADRSGATHRVALHGPNALGALGADLEPGRCAELEIAGAWVLAEREDSAGEVGVELLTRAEDAAVVFGALRDRGADHGLVAAGWHAWNIARIEAGTPVYFLDFGPDSIPQETGCFLDRVSTTKGCYLGQEVVARLQSLGKPKQVLAGLDVEAPAGIQPMTGDLLYVEGSEKPVGAVTSATVSPRAGERAIALAQVKTAHAAPGTALIVRTGDGDLAGTVRETLAAPAAV